MKRWAFITAGWTILVVAGFAILYQLVMFSGQRNYRATALVGLAGNSAKQKSEHQLICSQPSFLYSTNVLYPVCDSLNLMERWSKQFSFDSPPLTKKETYALLQMRIFLIYPKNEDEPLQIFALLESPEETIAIVNAVAASLQKQLEHFGDGSNGYDVWIRNATEAKLAVRWWQVLIRILEIAVPCGVVGFILIVFGRTMPPPVLIPQRQVVNRFSKY
jgi:hypothetical protein